MRTKLHIETTQAEAIATKATESADGLTSAIAKQDDLKGTLADAITPQVEAGYEVPEKGSTAAKVDWAALLKAVYPEIASKKIKNLSKEQKSRYSALNRAWSSLLTPKDGENATAQDCAVLNSIMEVLGMEVKEGVPELTRLVKRVKTRFPIETETGIAGFNEAVEHAETERRNALTQAIEDKKAELEAMEAEQAEIEESENAPIIG